MLALFWPLSESTLLQKAFDHFRSQRMRRFERTFSVTENTRILDVGGSPRIWQYASVRPRLTIVNLPSAIDRNNSWMAQVSGDGCLLPFGDACFRHCVQQLRHRARRRSKPDPLRA